MGYFDSFGLAMALNSHSFNPCTVNAVISAKAVLLGLPHFTTKPFILSLFFMKVFLLKVEISINILCYYKLCYLKQ